MSQKGILRTKVNGEIVEYYPQTTYDNVINETGGNLETDITELKQFKQTTSTKLDGIASSATKTEKSSTNGNIKINGVETTVYTHPTTSGNKHIPSGGSSGQILRWSADGTAVWGADKDTTYSVATTTTNGLMSSTDKSKLDGIATGANKYVHPTGDGNSHIPANGTSNSGKYLQATGTAGTYQWASLPTASTSAAGVVQLTTSTASTSTTLAATASAVKSAYDLAASKASTSVATTSANGLMSSTDKSKLDGIASGANNYSHPTSDGNKHVPANGTTNSGKYLQATATAGTYQWASLPSATTSASGIVQLSSATNSTSTTLAATASAVKAAYDLAASKAAASHGNHVPTTQTASNAVFLRNDNTWATVTPANIGAAASSHTHNYAGSSSAGGAATSALACTGNSATATTLATARTINGTSFNGSANITTANWGTARTLTIGKSGKSVNGSANVSWTLNEIGAVALPTDITGTTVDVNTYNLSSGSPKIQLYVETTTDGATNISNIPVKEPFMLWVENIRFSSSTDYITKQTFVSATTKSTYERWCTNGTWTAWLTNARMTTTPVSSQVLVSDGTAGGIKSSGYTIAKSVPSNAVFTDTVYTHPTTTGNKHIPSGGSSGQILRWAADGTAAWGADNNTTYSVATQSANGLMSSTDKTKLDGIATGANKTVLNNTVTSTSTTEAATANAVKTAYDKANHSHPYAASSHTHNYAGSSSAGGAATTALECTGNSATATKLQTTRTIFGRDFNGSANVAGRAVFYGTYTTLTSGRYAYGGIEIRESELIGTGTDNIGYAPQIGFNWSGRTGATLMMNGSGQFQFINKDGGYANVRGGTFTGTFSGNASTATTLATARTINGTSFNGSANITTANWGTARTLTIGNTGKSVNGSGNVSWSLSEIGALPLTGGTVNGTLAVTGDFGVGGTFGVTGTANFQSVGIDKSLYIKVSNAATDVGDLLGKLQDYSLSSGTYGNDRFGNSLNNWKTAGVWQCTNATTDVPVGDGWGTILIYGGFGNRYTQIYESWNYGCENRYIRTMNGGTNWSAWRLIGTCSSTTLSLLNGWTFASSFPNLNVIKTGNIVTVTGIVTGGTKTYGTPIATLPSGYTPKEGFKVVQIAYDGQNLTGQELVRLSISASGVIAVDVNFTQKYLGICFSFGTA